MENDNEWKSFESGSFFDELSYDWTQIPHLDDVIPASQNSQQSDFLGMEGIFPNFILGEGELDDEEGTGPTEAVSDEQWLEMPAYTPYTPLQFDDNVVSPAATTSSCSPLADLSPDASYDLQGPVLHIPDTPADANNNSLQYDVMGLVPAVVDAENLQIQHTNLMIPDVSSSDVTGEGDSTWGDDRGDDIGEFTEEYLFTVSTKDLNRRIQQCGLSEDVKKELKRRRRTIKNRGYARSCRQKRVGRHEEQDEEVLRLRREVKAKEQENERLKFELQITRAKCDALLAQREG